MSAPSVIIVGAGVIGLACAWRLARRGARVTVLEGEAENWSAHGPAASLAAAGMLAPISEAVHEEAAHPDIDALSLASFDLWRTSSQNTLFADGVRFDGAALIAHDGKEAERVSAHAEKLGRVAMPMTRGQWRKRTGLDAPIDHALFVADEGVADPGRVMSGLAMEIRRYGGFLEFDQDVEEVEPGRVLCNGGKRYSADRIVLAPGAWASDALIDAAPALAHVTPAKGHLVEVETAAPLHAAIRARNFYLAPRGERAAMLGSTSEPGKFDRRVERPRVDELLRAAERTLPGQVREGGRAWAGVRPMSPDRAPLIGPSGEALVSCGHSRNGWLLAPISAEIICAFVFNEDLPPLWTAFSPDRFN